MEKMDCFEHSSKMLTAVVFIIVKLSHVQCCTLQTERWLNTTVPGFQYYITWNTMPFQECKMHCKHVCNNSRLAIVRLYGVTPLITNEFQNTTCTSNVSLWILNLDMRDKCFMLLGKNINESTCLSRFRCFCQKRISTSYCSVARKTIGYLEFYIDYRAKTYNATDEYCGTMWNSSIIHYNGPLQYIKLSKSLGLEYGSYWLYKPKRQYNDTGTNCLVLNITDAKSFIIRANCREKFYSLCSSLRNATRVLDDSHFVEMIQNMTVNSKQTRKERSKLESADDTRTVTRVIGGGIGLFVLVPVVCLIVASDVQNLFKKTS